MVPRVARQARTIVTDSKYSRQDIARYLALQEDKVRVVWGAPNRACHSITDPTTLTAVRGKYALEQPFILGLAAVDPRKNTARIIEAYARFRQQIPRKYQLVLVGLSPADQKPFLRLAQVSGVADEVVMAGFIPEEDLVALYNAAELLVYPSLYEGFGLPVLEAMACDTPVVTSPRGSIPEVAGGAAIMVDPLNTEEIAGGMLSLVNDCALRKEVIARGRAQVQKFSWRQTAEQTLAVYQSVVV